MSENAPESWAQWKSKVRPKWLLPLCAFEWAAKWFAYRLKQWSLLDVLERLGHLAIVVAIITWLARLPFQAQLQRETADSARKAKIYQAWQVINTAQGKPGSGGRLQAIETLLEAKQPLIGADLSRGAYLPGIDLSEQDLTSVNLTGADLTNANFRGAEFERATLSHAKVKGADLRDVRLFFARVDHIDFSQTDVRGAKFFECTFEHSDFFKLALDNFSFSSGHGGHAVFTDASLKHADFSFAYLPRATFWNADLTEANFQAAQMPGARFDRATLRQASLSDANMCFVSLCGADLTGANLSKSALVEADLQGVKNWRTAVVAETNILKVRNAPEGFTDWALSNGALSQPLQERALELTQELLLEK